MHLPALIALTLTTTAFATQLSAQAPNSAVSDLKTNSDYLLGPGDQITVFVADLPDEFADKTFRIDSAGDVSLPMIGHLKAIGMTTVRLEAEAEAKLVHILNNPQVSISLVGFGSQSVSVLGAVNNPGLRQLEGHKTLFEVLSASGGLRADAGYKVTVTRNIKWGVIPLDQAHTDPDGKTSIASVNVKDLMTSNNPAENIAIMPGDTISVPKAAIVYAVGSVNKAGGFPLNENEHLSALQVLSLAEGLQKTAASSKAEILRTVSGSTQRIQIAVDLRKLMLGKGPDVPLQADDILFVPNSAAKAAGYRTVDAIVNAAGGAAVIATHF
jgi:polysaccharide export outer membrane protein